MRRLALILAALLALAALPARADEGDTSLIEAWLQRNLSAAGRVVTVTGFEGALRSRATVREITIADDAGVWFTLKNGVLDWTRSALLTGKLEVDALTAEEIDISRRPVAVIGGPQAETSDFALPELPVSINIGEITAQRVVLGAGVLGVAAQMKLTGGGRLEGGSGQAQLSLTRIDGARGTLSFEASYANASRDLALDLSLDEGPGGLVKQLTGLAGQGEIALTAKGSGKIDDFTAELTLATDGAQRVAGQVRLTGAGAGVPRAFEARLAGDISALVNEGYRPFFGTSSTLDATGSRSEAGFELSAFSLDTDALHLAGSGSFDATFWPRNARVSGQIAPPDGSLVQLPAGGTPTQVRGASFSLDYGDAAAGKWTGRFRVEGLTRDDLDLGSAELSGAGSYEASAPGVLPRFDGQLSFTASEVAPTDPALAQAVGPALSGSLHLAKQQGDRLAITGLSLSGADYGLAGDVTLGFDTTHLDLLADGKLDLTARDLGRFSALAGMTLSGGATLTASGNLALPGGPFDLAVDGSGQDIGIGTPSFDRVFGGASTLSFTAMRDEGGTRIDRFEIAAAHASASGKANLKSGASTITAQARLDDARLITDALSGPVSVDGTASQSASGWQVAAQAKAVGGSVLDLSGSLAPDFSTANLAVTGSAPIGLANAFVSGERLAGTAQFDLRLDGPLALTALSGTVSTSDGRVALPEFGTALSPVNATATLSGGSARLAVRADVTSGGQITVDGPVSVTAPYPATLSLRLASVGLVDRSFYDTSVSGQLAVTGPLTGGARVAGRLALGAVELRIPEAGFGVIGALPGLTHVNEPAAVRATRARAGLIGSGTGGGMANPFALDIALSAPNRIFLRGRGLDAELGGGLRIGGTSSQMITSGGFQLVRGRLDILGKRLTLTRANVTLEGTLDPVLDVAAETVAEDATVIVTVTGPASAPEVHFTSSPELPEDQILSLLIFGRSVQDISPLQALRLAAAAATLTGGGGGLTDKLRTGLGLADLDVGTGSDGKLAVTAGTYLSDNIYTDVTVGTGGKAEINLNLTLTRNLTARGRVSSDGETALGIYFDKDY